jgi:hypothetical protein
MVEWSVDPVGLGQVIEMLDDPAVMTVTLG